MRRTNTTLTFEDCLQVLMHYEHGHRNRALYALRHQHLRIKDIVHLKTVGVVVSVDGQVSRTVLNYDGDIVELDSRSRSLIYLYLVKRFKQSNLRAIEPDLPLFPTSKSDYLTVQRLTQLFWEMDTKIRHSAGVSTVRAVAVV